MEIPPPWLMGEELLSELHRGGEESPSIPRTNSFLEDKSSYRRLASVGAHRGLCQDTILGKK